MFANPPRESSENPPCPTLADEVPRVTENNEQAPLLIEAGARSGVAFDDDSSAALAITRAGAGVSADAYRAAAEGVPHAVRDVSQTVNPESRRVQTRAEIGPCPAFDDHAPLPVSGKSRNQETLPLDPLKDDRLEAGLQSRDDFEVDSLVVADLRDEDASGFERIFQGGRPHVQIAVTYRPCGGLGPLCRRRRVSRRFRPHQPWRLPLRPVLRERPGHIPCHREGSGGNPSVGS